MSKLLNISTNPHALASDNTQKLMRDVIIALAPAAIWGVVQFGVYAAVLLALSVASCMISEYVWNKYMNKEQTVTDYSAALTGLLLGMNLPNTVPFWVPIIGGVFAIIVVKQVFGGLGQNFMNPALGARCFLLISFAGIMTDFSGNRTFVQEWDSVTSATPLAMIKTGSGMPSLSAMFLGQTSGVIGEVSALLLIIGGVYLIYRKVITWDIPVIYIATVAVFMLLFGGSIRPEGMDVATFVMAQLFGGGLMLGAFFMATDYVTSPITPNGRIVYAVVIGCLTGIFRVFGNAAEGVSYAIILGNIMVPLIERVTLPKAFGREGK